MPSRKNRAQKEEAGGIKKGIVSLCAGRSHDPVASEGYLMTGLISGVG